MASVVFILGTIGLVRGPSKELGVTMALVVMLAVMTQFDALTNVDELPVRVNNALEGLGLGSDDVMRQRTMVVFLYSAAICLTAFMAYHGQDTLKFSFDDPDGFLGSVVGWLSGALNGYLIFGTIWYYLHQLDYPIQRYAWYEDNLTDLATNMVNLLPQNLASGMILSALALALLWWRILK